MSLFTQDKVSRLWELVEFLESHLGKKLTATQIANKIMCPQVNVVRAELHQLKTWGYPVVYNPSDDTYLTLKTNLETETLKLKPSEILSIFFFKEMASLYKGTHAYQQYSDVCKKLGTDSPLFYQNFLQYLFNNMTLGTHPKIELAQIVNSQVEILDAIEHHYEVEVKFAGHKDIERRKAKRIYQPLALKFLSGELYCYARDTFNKKIVPLKIETTAIITKTGQKFNPQLSLEEQKFISDSNQAVYRKDQMVHLEAKGSAAVFFNNIIFHPSQKIEYLNAGKTKVFLKLPINQELTNLILSFNADIEVLAPVALQNELQKTVQKLFKKYGSNNPTKKAS